MYKVIRIKKDKIRVGELKVRGKKIATPFFMPDATRAVVKLNDGDDLNKAGLEAMVVNTFHLYLQPGLKIIKKAKGVHSFMHWPGILLSDSGGFQVFSLVHQAKNLGKISDRGVDFRSPLDGSRHFLSPEKSIQIQFDLGVDMMVCLDDCPPNDFSRKDLEIAVNRTIAWAERCKKEYDKQIKKRGLTAKNRPLLFSVIQGGAELDLRKKCAEALVKLDFDGYGFGARPVDKDGKFLAKVLQYTADLIPENKLRFALGIGAIKDIQRCAKMGWDMFDCVIPTREGRHGRLFIKAKNGYTTININNAKFATKFEPISPGSAILALREHSKAYLHHLFRIKEPLGQKLATLNNLEVYMELMRDLRK